MLNIPIASIDETGFDLIREVAVDRLPLLAALSNDGEIRFSGSVKARIHAVLAGETVLISGTVSTRVSMRCSRCIEWFERDITADFSATALSDQTMAGDADGDADIELTAEETAAITYSGETISLNTEVAQQIIMELPFKPLCNDTCRGLCSRCGANLNQTRCQCDSRRQDNPFSILKTLSLPDKKE